MTQNQTQTITDWSWKTRGKCITIERVEGWLKMKICAAPATRDSYLVVALLYSESRPIEGLLAYSSPIDLVHGEICYSRDLLAMIGHVLLEPLLYDVKDSVRVRIEEVDIVVTHRYAYAEVSIGEEKFGFVSGRLSV